MKASNTSQSPQLYHDAISQRAREIWNERGQPVGQDVEIWLQAERDLVERGRVPGAPPSKRRTKVAADEIDQGELARRLRGSPDSGSRSATAVDPTNLT